VTSTGSSTAPEPVLPAQHELQLAPFVGVGLAVAVVAALVLRWRRAGR
jgi:hypothetical protein